MTAIFSTEKRGEGGTGSAASMERAHFSSTGFLGKGLLLGNREEGGGKSRVYGESLCPDANTPGEGKPTIWLTTTPKKSPGFGVEEERPNLSWAHKGGGGGERYCRFGSDDVDEAPFRLGKEGEERGPGLFRGRGRGTPAR